MPHHSPFEFLALRPENEELRDQLIDPRHPSGREWNPEDKGYPAALTWSDEDADRVRELAEELEQRHERGEIDRPDAASAQSMTDAARAYIDLYAALGVIRHARQLLGWGDYKSETEDHDEEEEEPVRNDDVRLMQPWESGLEYPVIVKRNPKGDGWDVLQSFSRMSW